jgi:hypothetical protein
MTPVRYNTINNTMLGPQPQLSKAIRALSEAIAPHVQMDEHQVYMTIMSGSYTCAIQFSIEQLEDLATAPSWIWSTIAGMTGVYFRDYAIQNWLFLAAALHKDHASAQYWIQKLGTECSTSFYKMAEEFTGHGGGLWTTMPTGQSTWDRGHSNLWTQVPTTDDLVQYTHRNIILKLQNSMELIEIDGAHIDNLSFEKDGSVYACVPITNYKQIAFDNIRRSSPIVNHLNNNRTLKGGHLFEVRVVKAEGDIQAYVNNRGPLVMYMITDVFLKIQTKITINSAIYHEISRNVGARLGAIRKTMKNFEALAQG